MFYVLYPLMIYVMKKCVCFSQEVSRNLCYCFKEFVQVVLETFTCIQLICIILKLNGDLKWTWNEVFWCYWVLFSLCVGLSISLVLATFVRSYYLLEHRENLNEEVKGLLWTLVSFIGGTVLSCIIVTGLVKYLDSQDSSTLLMGLWFNFLLNVFLFSFQMVNQDELKKFF
jgi:hypothetical protein